MIYKKVIGILLILLMILPLAGYTQECGPGCPVCSGTGRSTGALISPGTLIPSFLYIPGGEEETGVFNIRGGVTSWLDMGIGYTIEADKLIWSVRLQPIQESENGCRPAVILGTGSVQTGGSDQSLFLQLTKSWEFNEMFSARVSAGVATLMPEYEKQYGLAGLTLTITEQWSPFLSYDGLSLHPGLAWLPTDWLTIAGIFVESKELAISMGLRLNINRSNL